MVELEIVASDNIAAWGHAEQIAFEHLVASRQEAKALEDRSKRAREEIDEQLEAFLLMIGQPVRVQTPEVPDLHPAAIVQRVESRSADRIDGKLLLERGVSAATVKACTVEGKPYSYILVKNAKE